MVNCYKRGHVFPCVSHQSIGLLIPPISKNIIAYKSPSSSGQLYEYLFHLIKGFSILIYPCKFILPPLWNLTIHVSGESMWRPTVKIIIFLVFVIQQVMQFKGVQFSSHLLIRISCMMVKIVFINISYSRKSFYNIMFFMDSIMESHSS